MLSTIYNALTRLGAVRDGAIVIASALYLTGYVTWSIFAWTHHLGSVQPFDAQYFMIGIPVLAFAGTMLVLAGVVKRLLRRWHRFYRERPRRTRVRITRLCNWLAIVGIGGFLLASILAPQKPAIMISLGVLAFAGAMLKDYPDTDVDLAPVSYWITSALLSVAVAIAIVWFVTVAYAQIPQTFAGGAPRLANLAVSLETISPQMARDLGYEPQRSGKTFRSRDVWVIVLPGESLVVLTAPDLKSSQTRIELRRSVVPGILWRE